MTCMLLHSSIKECYPPPCQVGGRVCLVSGFVCSILSVKCIPVLYDCNTNLTPMYSIQNQFIEFVFTGWRIIVHKS